jgi:acyl-CoA synthetase (NDP forming)
MAECAQKGVRFAIVHSVCFSELGSEGKQLEQRMLEAASAGGVRVVDPNCMGIVSPHSNINTIVPRAKLPMEPGGVVFVGQSDWACENMLRLGSERGLRFSGIMSIGNQSDLAIEDFLEYFGADSETRVIAFYIAGNYALFEAISRQKGIISAQSLEELMDLAVVFSCP